MLHQKIILSYHFARSHKVVNVQKIRPPVRLAIFRVEEVILIPKWARRKVSRDTGMECHNEHVNRR